MQGAYGLPTFRQLRAAVLAAQDTNFCPLDVLNDAEVVRQLREAAYLTGFLSEMRKEAALAHSAELPPLTYGLFRQFESTGERADYERVYFLRRRRVTALTLAIVLDDRVDYLDALHDVVWAICNEYTWALPAHLPVGIDAVMANRVAPDQVVDLFAAETAHMLAELSHLLGDRLSGWLRYRIEHEIERRVFEPVFNYPQAFKWETDAHNWASVCGGSVGMAALLLVRDRERLAGMLDRVIRAMGSFLSGFGADGGCGEGIGYWVYGFGYYTYFAQMLADFTGGVIDLLESAHVRQIAAFPQAASLGHGRFVNYSDAPASAAILTGLGSYLAGRLQMVMPDLKPPDFHADYVYRWAHLTRDLVWSSPDALGVSADVGTFYLQDLAWVIDRRRIDHQMVVFSAKGGHNDEPHNHNDLGHFILQVGDEGFLIDLGAGVYTRQYFGDERYSLIHTGSHGHSVPLINGVGQAAGRACEAAVMAYAAHEAGVRYALDLSRAYPDAGVASFVRQFDWQVGAVDARLTLTDQMCFDALPANVESCFVSAIAPRIDDGVVWWQGKRVSVTMRFDARGFDVTIDEIETQAHDLTRVTVYRLRLRAREAQLVRRDDFVFEVNLNS